MVDIEIEPISRDAFAPFGDVLETASTVADVINGGTARRFTDLTRISLIGTEAQASVHIYRARAVRLPVTLRHVERHPRGSQLFMPLQGQPFLTVVAAGGASPNACNLRAFLVDRGDGINLARNTWHYPLLSLVDDAAFLVVEHIRPRDNLEECLLDTPARLASLPQIKQGPQHS